MKRIILILAAAFILTVPQLAFAQSEPLSLQDEMKQYNDALYPLAVTMFEAAAKRFNSRVDADERYKNLPADQRPYTAEKDMAFQMLALIQKYKAGDNSLRPVLEGLTAPFGDRGTFDQNVDALNYLSILYLERQPNLSEEDVKKLRQLLLDNPGSKASAK